MVHGQDDWEFEQGPIRPPSESGSLLLRLTRNCPWNRCTFCGLYKGERFSRRPVAHVLRDIELIARHVAFWREALVAAPHRPLSRADILAQTGRMDWPEEMAFHAARNWVLAGCRSVFLQDSNSLILNPDDLVTILDHLRGIFPDIERVTSYARSRTIDRISDLDLGRFRRAGLDRIHIGLESGSDRVLARVCKGADKATHIRAGLKVRRAGMELSEYVMPGLGGRELSREHALESADALNRIDADFIRLRTLAVPATIDLAAEIASGAFTKMGDLETAAELRLFLSALEGIGSRVMSDHILNLFEEIEGRLPADKERMLAVIDRFFALGREEQALYLVGRRSGLLRRLDDLDDPSLRRQVTARVKQWGVTTENAEQVADALMGRYI